CTDSREGRKLNRQFDEAYRERVREYHGTSAYAKAMRKRSVWVEPLFGEAKQWHGLRQFRLRGLDNVNMEALLVAAGQNLKRGLVARGGDGDTRLRAAYSPYLTSRRLCCSSAVGRCRLCERRQAVATTLPAPVPAARPATFFN